MEYMYPYHTEIYNENGQFYDEHRQLPFFSFFPGGFPGGFFPPTPTPTPAPSPGPPGQGMGGGMAPTSPPPQYVPQQPSQAQGPQLLAVDPGAIRRCLYRYTYVWLSRYQSFWFFPTFIGRRSIAGYRWTGFNWVYFGIDLDRIQSFTCV